MAQFKKKHLKVKYSVLLIIETGVVFDSKLNWSDHIVYAINWASWALNAIKLIRKFFYHEGTNMFDYK